MISLAHRIDPAAGSGRFPLAEAISVVAGLVGLAALLALVGLLSAAPQVGAIDTGSSPRALAVSSWQSLDASRAGTSVPDASVVFAQRPAEPETLPPTF